MKEFAILAAIVAVLMVICKLVYNAIAKAADKSKDMLICTNFYFLHVIVILKNWCKNKMPPARDKK